MQNEFIKINEKMYYKIIFFKLHEHEVGDPIFNFFIFCIDNYSI